MSSAFAPALDFTLDFHHEYGHDGIVDASRFDDDFDEALAFTLPQEGGEVDDPDDPGGHTNHGITQATYTRWQKSKGISEPRSVSLITMAEVMLIYDEAYWDPGHCNELAPVVAMVHFDACVNFGIPGALQILQRACKVRDDGVWGPVTAHIIGSEPPLVLVENLCWERLATYCRKVKERPVKTKFLRGWSLRVIALRQYARDYLLKEAA